MARSLMYALAGGHGPGEAGGRPAEVQLCLLLNHFFCSIRSRDWLHSQVMESGSSLDTIPLHQSPQTPLSFIAILKEILGSKSHIGSLILGRKQSREEPLKLHIIV